MNNSIQQFLRPKSITQHATSLAVAASLLATAGVSFGASERKYEMSSDGSVHFGSRIIQTKKDYGSVRFTIDNDIQGSMGEIFDFGEGYLSPPFFLDHVQEVKDGTSSFATNLRVSTKSDQKIGTYVFSLTLLDDGWVRVSGVTEMPDPLMLKARYLTIELPPFLRFHGKLIRGISVKEFDESKPIEFSEAELKGSTLVLFPGDPGTEFSIRMEACSQLLIKGNRISVYPDAEGKISYLVDLREKETTSDISRIMPNGINVWGPDLLGTPDYSTSRNLILNPSFEAGFRHWSFRIFSDFELPLEYQDIYVIDDQVAHSGTKSLRLRAMKSPLPFATFALPVTPDAEYTLSFWAKSSEGKTPSLYIDARSGNSSPIEGMPMEAFPITDEWQRYQVSFTVQSPFVSIFFRPVGDPNFDSFVWIDDVQFEAGPMTDFDQAPVLTEFLSSARGNFLEFGRQPDFRFVVNAAPMSKGSVAVSIQDFFFNTVFDKEFSFEADESGKAVIALPELDRTVVDGKLRGVFEVTASVQIDGDAEPFVDYARFSVMNFLKNEHRNSRIFDITYAWSLQAGGPEMERFVEREMHIGYGSYSYDFVRFGNDLDLKLDKERADLMEKYGFEPTGRMISTALTNDGEISEMDGEMKVTGLKNMIDPTPEQLAAVEEIARVKAERRPWSPVWFLTAETDPAMMPMAGHLEAFAKLNVASARGIKRGNPNAKVLVEGGPWNIQPDLGIPLYEKYIQAVKDVDPTVEFDGAAGHHYINFPEPLDEHVQAFLDMLDRNGHPDWPLYLNEGGGFTTMNIPQLGITPYVWNSSNYWYLPAISYGIGRAERIGAALMARAWLIALKYQHRVVCMNNFFMPNRYLDVDFAPRIWDKIPNTLGRILGDAYFYQDVKFVPYARAYVFRQDADGAPVAALWGFKETVDRFKEKPTTVRFDFRDLDPTFIDLMENTVTFPKDEDGFTLIPMTPFPIFIKGDPGSQDALAKAIAGGTAVDGNEADALQASAYPTGDDHATVELKNNLPRNFAADTTITLNGTEIAKAVKLLPLEEISQQLEMPGAPAAANQLLPFDFALRVGDGNAVQIDGTYLIMESTPASPISVDGISDEWSNTAALDLGDNVSMKSRVEDGAVSFMIEVKGENLDRDATFTGVGFYFNPFEPTGNWAAPQNAKGDLGIYELKKDDRGTLSAYCHIVQGVQAGSSSSVLFQAAFQPRFEVKTGTTSDGVFVECRIPEVLLSPLRISPGCRFGLNVSIPVNGGLKSLAAIPDNNGPGTLVDLKLIMAIFSPQSKAHVAEPKSN